MDVWEAMAYGQRLADLYGFEYYVYPVSGGHYMVTPEMGWTPTVMPIYVACHNIVATMTPRKGGE